MFLYKPYTLTCLKTLIDYRKKMPSDISYDELRMLQTFLNELNTHLENSIEEATRHKSAFIELVNMMAEHPRTKPRWVRRWALDVLAALATLDNHILALLGDVNPCIASHSNDFDMVFEIKEVMNFVIRDLEKFMDMSSHFSKQFIIIEEDEDNLDHKQVIESLKNTLINKDHLNKAFVDNIVSWF